MEETSDINCLSHTMWFEIGLKETCDRNMAHVINVMTVGSTKQLIGQWMSDKDFCLGCIPLVSALSNPGLGGESTEP